MKTTLPLLLLAGALTLAVPYAMNAQAPLPSTLKAETFAASATVKYELRYLLYLPKDYPADAGKRWPLMLFLHGAGERGTDLTRVAVHGPPSLVRQGTNFPFIIVAPQCPEGQIWSTATLMALLDQVTARLAVDPNRVYVTGLSMGGYGTWSLLLAHPERFAAAAPICGGGNFIEAMLGGQAHQAALRTLPVWAFHGGKDPVVPLAESERMVEGLKHLGATDVKLTVYPEADHNSWAQTYRNPEFYQWLLKQSRHPAAAGR